MPSNERRRDLLQNYRFLPLDAAQRRLAAQFVDAASDEQVEDALEEIGELWDLLDEWVVTVRPGAISRAERVSDLQVPRLPGVVADLGEARAKLVEDSPEALPYVEQSTEKALALAEFPPRFWDDGGALIYSLQEFGKVLRTELTPGQAAVRPLYERLALLRGLCRCCVTINRIGRAGRELMSLRRQLGYVDQVIPIADSLKVFTWRKEHIEANFLEEVRSLASVIPPNPEELRIDAGAGIELDDHATCALFLSAADVVSKSVAAESACALTHVDELLPRCGVAQRYYDSALAYASTTAGGRPRIVHRSARNMLLQAKLLHKAGDTDAAVGILHDAVTRLEALRHTDYVLTSGRQASPVGTDVLRAECLLTALSMRELDQTVSQGAAALLGRIVLSRQTPSVDAPAAMLVRLFRDILNDCELGLAYVAGILAHCDRPRVRAVLEDVIERLHDDMAGPRDDEDEGPDILYRIAQAPSDFDALEAFLRTYAGGTRESPNVCPATCVRYLRRLEDNKCPLYHAAIWAVLVRDGHTRAPAYISSERCQLLFLLVAGTSGEGRVCDKSYFDKEMRFAVEALSKFYLTRSRRTADSRDLEVVYALLEAGLLVSCDPYWKSRLIEAYLLGKEFSRADALLVGARENHPEDPVFRLQKARLLVARGSIAEARELFEGLARPEDVASGAVHPAVVSVYAAICLRSQDPRRAEELYQSLLRRNPSDHRASFGLAQVLQGLRRYEEALGVWLDCIATHSQAERPYGITWPAARGLAATIKTLEAHSRWSDASKQLLTASLASLPDQELGFVLKAFEVVGPQTWAPLRLLHEVVGKRPTRSLRRRLAQTLMSAAIEMYVFNRLNKQDLAYFVSWCRQEDILGDLFAGAKGSYRRCLLRLYNIPPLFKAFCSSGTYPSAEGSGACDELISHVAKAERTETYYSTSYELCKTLVNEVPGDMLPDMVERLISCVARTLVAQEQCLETSLIRVPAICAFWPVDNGPDTTTAWHDSDKLLLARRLYGFSRQIDSLSELAWELERPPADGVIQSFAEGKIYFGYDRKSCHVGLRSCGPDLLLDG